MKGSLRFVGVFLDLFAQSARAILQDSLDIVVEHVSIFVQHQVVSRAIKLFKTQVTRIFIENMLDCIFQLFPPPDKMPSMST
jgi:hypothetical protein